MTVAHWLLRPAAGLYGGVLRARNLYYDRVRSATQRAALPVFSVGNITVGGTGKTPFVIALVRQLRALGRRPAILTRGYHAPPGQTADEVLEFHDALPDVPVVVNPDRVAGAASARAQQGADCVVLDDGFQHRRLARDLDIVLIDALQPWGGGWLLPAGRLREPLSSLRRADVFVITRANQAAGAAVDAIAGRLRSAARESSSILRASIAPDVVVFGDGRRAPATELAGRRVLPVCGLGNPDTFEQLVRDVTGLETPALRYPDHHAYAPGDVSRLIQEATARGVEPLVTTRKDWVKLRPLWPADARLELVRLDVSLTVQDADGAWLTRLEQVFG